MDKVTLEKVRPENLSDCSIGCLTDPKNQGYQPKVEWLQRRFAEGLRFLLFWSEQGSGIHFHISVGRKRKGPGVDAVWRDVASLMLLAQEKTAASRLRGNDNTSLAMAGA